jgi:TrpR family trp operon transcriptional repressor
MYSNVKTIKEIARVLTEIDNPVLMEDLLGCLLTKNELREIAGRWELVKLLERGFSQRKVAHELSMSLCKITRGSKELKKKNSAFKKVLDEYLKKRSGS